jgi:hypothetical protein
VGKKPEGTYKTDDQLSLEIEIIEEFGIGRYGSDGQMVDAVGSYPEFGGWRPRPHEIIFFDFGKTNHLPGLADTEALEPASQELIRVILGREREYSYSRGVSQKSTRGNRNHWAERGAEILQ